MYTPHERHLPSYQRRSLTGAIAGRAFGRLLGELRDLFFGDPTISELSALSDRELNDIGLQRLDVAQAAQLPRGERPRALSRAASIRRHTRMPGI